MYTPVQIMRDTFPTDCKLTLIIYTNNKTEYTGNIHKSGNSILQVVLLCTLHEYEEGSRGFYVMAQYVYNMVYPLLNAFTAFLIRLIHVHAITTCHPIITVYTHTYTVRVYFVSSDIS